MAQHYDSRIIGFWFAIASAFVSSPAAADKLAILPPGGDAPRIPHASALTIEAATKALEARGHLVVTPELIRAKLPDRALHACRRARCVRQLIRSLEIDQVVILNIWTAQGNRSPSVMASVVGLHTESRAQIDLMENAGLKATVRAVLRRALDEHARNMREPQIDGHSHVNVDLARNSTPRNSTRRNSIPRNSILGPPASPTSSLLPPARSSAWNHVLGSTLALVSVIPFAFSLRAAARTGDCVSGCVADEEASRFERRRFGAGGSVALISTLVLGAGAAFFFARRPIRIPPPEVERALLRE